ncbi:MAG: EamA family transporter [Candidatus Micrarchaeia archaeon]
MIAWYYLAILSSIFMGLSTIVEKRALKTEHPTAYSASFATLVAIVSLIFIPWARFDISVSTVAIIYVLSVISTSTYVLTAKVYKHSSISIATPILSSLPMFFVILLAFAFLGEKLSMVQYVSVAVLIIATYLILGDRDEPKRKYVIMLVLVSFLSGIGFIVTKYLLGGMVNAFAFLILSEIFIAFNMLLYISIKFGGLREVVTNTKANKVPILTIVALAIAYRLTFYLSLYTAQVSLAMPLRNTANVLLIVIGGGLLFKEVDLKKKLVLALVMVACAYVLVV